VPVGRELDLKRLAETLRGRRAVLAAPAEAERASGSVVGAISPLAMRRSLPTVVDASAEEHPTVFVSAGRRGLQLELAAADLVRVTGATVAPVARSR
jgi:Cys-tRNA(Pro)/Cys-tRNA(Cys) deacylase